MIDPNQQAQLDLNHLFHRWYHRLSPAEKADLIASTESSHAYFSNVQTKRRMGHEMAVAVSRWSIDQVRQGNDIRVIYPEDMRLECASCPHVCGKE